MLSSSRYLRNIASMRWVTAKPPNMLIVASPMAPHRQPAYPLVRPRQVGRDLGQVRRDLHQRADRDDAADTALVTLISGVCSAGFTFHTTM